MERKFGKFAIPHLMNIVVFGMAVVFLLDLIAPTGVIHYLSFDLEKVREGQFWRLFTLAFLPPNSSPIFIVFSLYFYWLIGGALEREWGAFRFNLFYLFGLLTTLIAGVITGYATNSYLNMSLYFAFAILYPNFQLMLFFFLPIKIKYLAIFNALFYVISLIFGSWQSRIALVISLLNLALFFWRDAYNLFSRIYRQTKWKRSMRR